MKRTILTVEIDPEFRQFLQKKADKRAVNLSKYVRAALIKVSGYKEKKIV